MLKQSSVSVAKNRLKALVTSDRVQCLPDSYESICRELYETISKIPRIDSAVTSATNIQL